MDDSDLRTLLQALPTKADIEVLIPRVKEANHKDLQVVWTEVQVLPDRFTAEETATTALKKQVLELETARDSQTEVTMTLQLYLEDWSRQNNVQLHGLPEATAL